MKIFAILLIFITGLYAYSQNTNVFKEQGGSRMVVGSGGSLDVASGGEIDVESGGALKLAGVAITSTAAELNLMDGVTATVAELNQTDETSQSSDGKLLKKIVRATLDCGASSCVAGTVSMVQTLPAKAIITQAYFFTVTQFVDGGAGTVALHCEDADNIFAAADITGIVVDTITSGVPIGTAGTMAAGLAAQCTITATIAVAEQTAGVLNLWVEYVIHD